MRLAPLVCTLLLLVPACGAPAAREPGRGVPPRGAAVDTPAAGAVDAAAAEAEALAALDALVGVWEGRGVTTLAEGGRELPFRARTEARWDLGGTLLVERTVLRVEGAPESRSLALWTWDAAAGLHRTWRMNDAGLREEGSAVWDPEARVWRIVSRTVDTRTGAVSRGSGEMRFTSPDAKTYTWTARDEADGRALFEVEGRSKRVVR